MKVLVTGGSGFIGTNYIEHLLQRDDAEFLNLSSHSPRHAAHLKFWKKCDILDKESVMEIVKDFRPTHVVHLAAKCGLNDQALSDYAANTEGTRNVIQALAGCPSVERVIFTSSTLVCRIGYVPKHDADYCPSTLYGLSKVKMEQIVRGAGELPFVWTIVRPVSIWGPWFGEPYKNLFRAIAKGWYIHIGDGPCRKSLGYVENTVYQLHKLLLSPIEKVHQKTLYLADDPPTELYEFCRRIGDALGRRSIPRMPVSVARVLARGGDILRSIGWRTVPLTSFRLTNILTEYIYDVKPVMEIAGPLPYDVKTGIKRTIEWMRSRGEI